MQKNAKEVPKMINTQDQQELLELIAQYLKEDIHCIAIGGTAMMFLGYKNATKDIDLVFQNNKDRKIFIDAIKDLGYSQKSLEFIYDKKRAQDKNKPVVYSRGDERFDLFVGSVFGSKVDFSSKDVTQRHDFIAKKELIVYTLSKEDIILLKSVTNREKDLEDIEAIIKIEKSINWDYIIDKAILQRKNNSWILIDLEEKMQKLKKITFIKKQYFDKIYKEEEKYHK